jgi:hypothetical protein
MAVRQFDFQNHEQIVTLAKNHLKNQLLADETAFRRAILTDTNNEISAAFGSFEDRLYQIEGDLTSRHPGVEAQEPFENQPLRPDPFR